MPLYPELNALFVHIPKNAGRSIEQALTPASLRGRDGRRSVASRGARLLQRLTANPVARTRLTGTLDLVVAAQHLTLSDIQSLGLASRSDLAALYKFCVVRNPFDRAISSVLHFGRDRFRKEFRLGERLTPEGMERAILAWLDIEPRDHNLLAHRRPQADYLSSPDRDVAMDCVMRFERLGDDYQQLGEALGAPLPDLPWVGRSRSDAIAYRDLYTATARKAVERAFERDLDLFGYRFD
jgi:hypothetical protein